MTKAERRQPRRHAVVHTQTPGGVDKRCVRGGVRWPRRITVAYDGDSHRCSGSHDSPIKLEERLRDRNVVPIEVYTSDRVVATNPAVDPLAKNAERGNPARKQQMGFAPAVGRAEVS